MARSLRAMAQSGATVPPARPPRITPSREGARWLHAGYKLERIAPMSLFALPAFAIALLAVTAPASAQTYPSRTVTVVVPFPAGGSVDGVARILVQKLNETMGQHFIVENRAGGASGIVGANAVAKAAPDGYTLLLSASVHVINPFLYKSVPYDVVHDFTPVTLLAEGPLIVSTTPSVPANNLKDFFALVRKDPGPRPHQPQARHRGARNSDRGGVRRDRLRIRVVVRIVGPQEPAGRNLRQAADGNRQTAGAAGREGAAQRTRIRPDRHGRGRVRPLHSRGDGEIRENHQGGQDQGGVSAPRATWSKGRAKFRCDPT